VRDVYGGKVHILFNDRESNNAGVYGMSAGV